jgi:hypothetical protein
MSYTAIRKTVLILDGAFSTVRADGRQPASPRPDLWNSGDGFSGFYK